MQLRSRITITFVALLAAVFATTLAIVSIANRQNAGREISREFTVGASVLERVLDSNQRQLKQAADVLAQDFGFRTAVASADTDTIRSVLENHGERIGADVVVLSDTAGRTMAAAGPEDAGLPGLQFVDSARGAGSETARLALRGQRVYQVVEVVIRAPLPIARVVMGFELDAHMLAEVSGILGVDVTLLVSDGRRWQVAGSTLDAAAASTVRDALAARKGTSPELAAGDLALRASELTRMRAGQPAVVAVLSRSRSLLQAQFDRLTRVLWIATLLGLGATALSGWWLARGITRPLSRLTAAVDRIRRGEYDADVAAERDDEVGVLARGLGEMRTQVVDRDASIRRLAFEDPLTGLRNRTGFVAAVEQRLAAGGVAAIAVIDLRRFRIINECLGFAVGDQVLRHVGERLQAAASEPAQVARLAADQFALMADAGVGDAAAAAAWAQSLLARLSRPVQIEAQSIDIAPVVGLAIGPQDATEAAALLRCADMALDLARRRSLGVAAFGPEIPVPGRDQLSLLGELQRAVREDELRLAVQPKIDLRSGAVRGAEVLLRWQHPQRGWISPGEFIPFAERTGFVRHLTEWALAKSAQLARQLDDAGLPVTLSVNISAVDLAHPQLDDQVRAAIAAAGVPPQRLTLEVTESGFIDNPREALAMLEALRSIGVRLSIDDFGTGYSSLSYLAHMPVDELKVDQSFVRGLEQDAALVAVVGAATEMGHRLGLSVVAEGVETEAQARILRELGCDVAQGYLYARPMTPEQLRDWLSGRKLWQPQAAGSIGAVDAAARSAERAQHL